MGPKAPKPKKTDSDDEEEEDDDDLINHNHVTKKLNISDLSKPRELSRRERFVLSEYHLARHLTFTGFL